MGGFSAKEASPVKTAPVIFPFTGCRRRKTPLLKTNVPASRVSVKLFTCTFSVPTCMVRSATYVASLLAVARGAPAGAGLAGVSGRVCIWLKAATVRKTERQAKIENFFTSNLLAGVGWGSCIMLQKRELLNK